MGTAQNEQWLIKDKVLVRPDEAGGFDELVLYDGHGECLLHAEMMSDGCLWVGIYPPGETERRAVMWITAAKRGKLIVLAEDD